MPQHYLSLNTPSSVSKSNVSVGKEMAVTRIILSDIAFFC